MKITQFHATSNAEQSARCLKACRQQATAHNLAIEHLLENPDEPLGGNGETTKGRGLIARWAEWARDKPWMKAIPEPAWQVALVRAKMRATAWKRKKQEHQVIAETRRKAGKRVPADVRQYNDDAAKLFISRKRQNSKSTNVYRVFGGVQRTGTHTLTIPGIGEIQTIEKVPALQLRGAVVLQTKRRRTKTAQRVNETRGWRIDLETEQHKPQAPHQPDKDGRTPAEDRRSTSAEEQQTTEGVARPAAPAAHTRTADGEKNQETRFQEPQGLRIGAPEAAERHSSEQDERAYRLVELTKDGAASTERQGYSSLEAAEAARANNGQGATAAIARVQRSGSDLLRIDGEWLADATPKLTYSEEHRPTDSRKASSSRAQTVSADEIMAGTVPTEWRGRSALSPEGHGVLWTGTTFERVTEHRYQPGGQTDPIYAWSILATDNWRKRTLESEQRRTEHRRTVLPIDEDQRHAWGLPQNTAYVILEPASDPAATEGARARNAVPVLEAELDQLARAEALRPETRSGPYFRAAEVSTVGWHKTGTEAFTRIELAEERAGDTSGTVIVESDGLDDGVTTIDGRPAAANGAIGRPTYEHPVAHQQDAPGSMRLDEEGNGHVYDGRELIRIESGKVPPDEAGPAGMPAWVYGVLAKASPTPRHKSVHGIIVQVTAAERKEWNLPEEAHQALVLRHRNKTDELEVSLVTRAGMQGWRDMKGHLVPVGTWRRTNKLPDEIAGNRTDEASRPRWRRAAGKRPPGQTA